MSLCYRLGGELVKIQEGIVEPSPIEEKPQEPYSEKEIFILDKNNSIHKECRETRLEQLTMR